MRKAIALKSICDYDIHGGVTAGRSSLRSVASSPPECGPTAVVEGAGGVCGI